MASCTQLGSPIISIIQIHGNASSLTDISVSDLAEYCADFDPSEFNKLNFSEMISDDISYLKKKTEIDIEIFDKKRELKQLNKIRKEILSDLGIAINMLINEQEKEQ